MLRHISTYLDLSAIFETQGSIFRVANMPEALRSKDQTKQQSTRAEAHASRPKGQGLMGYIPY